MSDQVDTLDEQLDRILGDYGADRAQAYKVMSVEEYSKYAEKIKARAKAKLSARDLAIRIDEAGIIRRVVGSGYDCICDFKIEDRIKELQQGVQGSQGNSQDDTTPTAVGNKADNPCPDCGGSGHVQRDYGKPTYRAIPCPTCHGTGFKHNEESAR